MAAGRFIPRSSSSPRARAHRALMDVPRAVVQDRSFYEDAEVFARALHIREA